MPAASLYKVIKQSALFNVAPSHGHSMSLLLPFLPVSASWRETGLFLVSKWQDVQLLLWAFAWMVPFDSSPWLCPARSSGFQLSCLSGAIISQAQDWARLSASTVHGTHTVNVLMCRLAIICLLLTSTSH